VADTWVEKVVKVNRAKDIRSEVLRIMIRRTVLNLVLVYAPQVIQVLEFVDAMYLAVLNTRFEKEEGKLVTYETRECGSFMDYILVC